MQAENEGGTGPKQHNPGPHENPLLQRKYVTRMLLKLLHITLTNEFTATDIFKNLNNCNISTARGHYPKLSAGGRFSINHCQGCVPTADCMGSLKRDGLSCSLYGDSLETGIFCLGGSLYGDSFETGTLCLGGSLYECSLETGTLCLGGSLYEDSLEAGTGASTAFSLQSTIINSINGLTVYKLTLILLPFNY